MNVAVLDAIVGDQSVVVGTRVCRAKPKPFRRSQKVIPKGDGYPVLAPAAAAPHVDSVCLFTYGILITGRK